MRWLAIVVPLLIALAACEGPVGPQGPAGDVGPEGLPGPGLRLTATGVIGADSTAAVEVVGGRLADLPALTSYVSETGAVWIPVTDVLCVLVETPAGNLGVVLVGGMPGHWRLTVFTNELMTGFITTGANPLSRVTVASFGDLGYVVDEGGADAFQLNFSAAPRAVGEEVEMFPLGDDIWRGTIYLLDEEGRVRGVLQ